MTLKKKKKNKPWAGRFSTGSSKILEDFTESISFDQRLAFYDVKASIAHTLMMKRTKIITGWEAEKIINGLSKIMNLVQKNRFKFSKNFEDVHMNIESYLVKLVGEVGKKLHTARSRNDQVAVDMMLYLKDESVLIINLIKNLQKSLLAISRKSIKIIIPGYTHLKQGQPILLAHFFLSYFFKFQRDLDKFRKSQMSLNVLPLGAGAMAGVNYATDRKYLARLLKFSHISENSMDTVSQRDYIIEFIFCCSMVAMHLSRLAEDLIIFNSDEFNYVEIADAFTTGSSIMPNKKNPDVLELVRGKSSKILGNLSGIFTLLKGLPTSYNRDLQEDKKILFETIDYIKPMLQITADVLDHISFHADKIKEKMRDGFILAVDIADYLVKKNIPFRQAHYITGSIIKYCIHKKKKIFDLDLKEFKKYSKDFKEDIFSILDYKKSVESKISYGGTSTRSIKKQMQIAKILLNKK
ncbi:MAG: argininosuccinate lyase [Spirochaetes bacterium]|nr:argininosuccinate lyase [Spirochaetota bacterium]